jgi:hypothetical protein
MDETVRRAPALIVSGRACALLRPAPAMLAAALLAFASGGCEPATSSDTVIPDAAIRSDSAGIELVEHLSLPPIEASRIAIAAEPDLVLGGGGAFGDPDYEFFQIRGVSQLRDGTLVVANWSSSELRFYGADGHFLRSVGGEGEGPGEFRSLWDHWIIAGDTIVAWDMQARRFQHFSPDGAFVRTTSMAAVPFTEFSTRPPVVETVLGNGRAVVSLDSPVRPTDGAERLPRLVAFHRINDGGWDSVRVVSDRELVLDPIDDQGGFRPRSYHLGAYPVAAGAGATVAVADAARFRVELLDSNGRLVSVLSASVPEVPVSADVLEGEVEHQMAHAPSTAAEESIRRSVLAMHAPFLPAIRDIFVDADERIWVERYDVPARGPSRWEVFERDGTWTGRVEMPEGFARGTMIEFAPGFSVASGRLAGVWTDPDTGVETVRVYRVIEPDS